MRDAIVEISVESLAAGGDALGRDADGRVTFVPGAAPGDRVRVRIVEEHRTYARAELLEVLAPSSHRVEPPCPLFANGSCGGCQWQHVALEVQRRAKEAICAAALRHRIDAGMTLRPIEAPVPGYGWRRRARLHWIRRRREEPALLGFYAPRSRRVTDVGACPQLEPALERALPAIREHLTPHLHGRGELQLVAGHAGEVHAAVHGSCPPSAARALVEEGGLAGVRLGRQSFGARRVELEPAMPGRADRFAQASLAGNHALVDLVAEAAAPLDDRRVLELHAGTGNLTRVLVAGGASVLAVDERKPPWRLPGGAGVAFRRGRDRDVARALADADESFDLVLLDPPRTGARDLVEPIATLAPSRIVYVSCDPATLARDLDELATHGYRALWAQPLDLMPQTAHVELVASLSRAPV